MTSVFTLCQNQIKTSWCLSFSTGDIRGSAYDVVATPCGLPQSRYGISSIRVFHTSPLLGSWTNMRLVIACGADVGFSRS
jgi:hypothetical protein